MECLNGEHNNETIVKELALYNQQCFQSYLFQPPYAVIGKQWSRFRESNRWVREHLNGFSWYDGQISYSELKKMINQIAFQFPLILTKGLQKKKFIADIIGKDGDYNANVVNIEDFGCPNHKHINSTGIQQSLRCQFHYAPRRERFQCATEKAVKYFNWLQQEQQKAGTKDEQ